MNEQVRHRAVQALKMSRLPLRKFFPVVLWLSGEPARQSRASPPTWRHAADVSHQLRSSGRLRRPLAPSRAGLAFDRRNRSNQIESHPKQNPGAGLVRAPRPKPRSRPRSKTEAAEPASLSSSPTDCDTCGNLRRRGVGVFDTPTSGDACEGVCQTHQPPNHRGNFSERPERHAAKVQHPCVMNSYNTYS